MGNLQKVIKATLSNWDPALSSLLYRLNFISCGGRSVLLTDLTIYLPFSSHRFEPTGLEQSEPFSGCPSQQFTCETQPRVTVLLALHLQSSCKCLKWTPSTHLNIWLHCNVMVLGRIIWCFLFLIFHLNLTYRSCGMWRTRSVYAAWPATLPELPAWVGTIIFSPGKESCLECQIWKCQVSVLPGSFVILMLKMF